MYNKFTWTKKSKNRAFRKELRKKKLKGTNRPERRMNHVVVAEEWDGEVVAEKKLARRYAFCDRTRTTFSCRTRRRPRRPRHLPRRARCRSRSTRVMRRFLRSTYPPSVMRRTSTLVQPVPRPPKSPPEIKNAGLISFFDLSRTVRTWRPYRPNWCFLLDIWTRLSPTTANCTTTLRNLDKPLRTCMVMLAMKNTKNIRIIKLTT